jgi:hypothetical protein
VQALTIPLLIVLGLAASLERRLHHALFVARYGDPDDLRWLPGQVPADRRADARPERSRLDRGPASEWDRVRGFLASDAGILVGIFLLAGTGIAGLFWIQ